MRENLARRVAEQHLGVIHHKQTVGNLCDILHRVGHDEDGRAGLLVVAADQLKNLVTARRIEARGRLIEHEYVRPHGDNACDGYAALLTAGQRKRRLVGKLRCKADCRHGFAHALVNLGLRQFHVGRAVGNVLRDGLLEQLVFRILEHQTDAEARFAAALALGIPDGLAVEQDLALGRLQQTVQVLNERRLARTGVTDHTENFAFFDFQVNMVKRNTLKGGACAVNVRQAPRFKYG